MEKTTPFIRKMSLVTAVSALLLAPAMQVVATEPQQASAAENIKAGAKEGWKEGMIEGAFLFNDHLSALDIDVDVQGSTAILTGYVDSSVAKSLAQEIALSVDGITEVNNELQVDASRKKNTTDNQSLNDVKEDVSDAAITMKIKTKLLANSEISGLKINVDTADQRVTLSGNVKHDAERDLAYYIARNTDGVRAVNNQLKVEGNS